MELQGSEKGLPLKTEKPQPHGRYSWWQRLKAWLRPENVPEFWDKTGSLICEGCRRAYPLAGFQPLTMESCPQCGDLIFVPMKIDDFWLMEPLGSGGMGSVYKAWHPDYEDQYLAVKIAPRFNTAANLRPNLIREIETLRAIGFHPAIANLVFAKEDPEQPYMVTHFIDGERLDLRIRRLGKLSEEEVLLTALTLLSALAFIYQCGFLYRDLKPQNIIVTEEGPCLIDFGICRSIRELDRMPEPSVEGSALYCPPERMRQEKEGPWSEIYSLGMVMYHALAGAPYVTARDIETITALN
ncbi:MAG: serine/threonine protein kinase, partial [Lentisphaerae bacterium]